MDVLESDRLSKPLDLATASPVIYNADATNSFAEPQPATPPPMSSPEADLASVNMQPSVTATVAIQTGLVYSSVMMLHAFPSVTQDPDDVHPEAPERISRAFIVLRENGCISRMKRIQPREVLCEEVSLIHDVGVWKGVYRSQCKSFRSVDVATAACKEASFRALAKVVRY